MPKSEKQLVFEVSDDQVLTPKEAAAYLRVSEDALSKAVTDREIPAQKIGGEWRFLKGALADWLRFGPYPYQEFKRFPLPWLLEHPVWEEFFRVLEGRILSKLHVHERTTAKPGSKHAVLRHFGVFQGDTDLEEQLAGIRARREADEE